MNKTKYCLVMVVVLVLTVKFNENDLKRAMRVKETRFGQNTTTHIHIKWNSTTICDPKYIWTKSKNPKQPKSPTRKYEIFNFSFHLIFWSVCCSFCLLVIFCLHNKRSAQSRSLVCAFFLLSLQSFFVTVHEYLISIVNLIDIFSFLVFSLYHCQHSLFAPFASLPIPISKY